MKYSRYGGVVVLGLFLLASVGAIILRQDIRDWWRLRDYHPAAVVQQIVAEDQLTDYGKKVFYVAHPAVEARTSFNQHCTNRGEKSIVLGCYDGRNIYVYDVTNKQLDGVKQVTAAHEMLHAAYDRLPAKEKQQINSELEQQLTSLHDAHIDQLVQEYKRTEPGELDNELHSILGTEVSSLNPTLEQYYTKYFHDRSIIAKLASQYETVFTESENQIDSIDSQLSNLRSIVSQNEATLQIQQSQLNAQEQQMNQLRAQGNTVAYNAQVDDFNNQVNEFNSQLVATKDLISQYNQLVATRNNLATAHNTLAQSLNSNIAPLPAQ